MRLPDDPYLQFALYAGAAAILMAVVLVAVLCIVHIAFQNQRARTKVAELEADRLRVRLESIERVQEIRNTTVSRMVGEVVVRR